MTPPPSRAVRRGQKKKCKTAERLICEICAPSFARNKSSEEDKGVICGVAFSLVHATVGGSSPHS